MILYKRLATYLKPYYSRLTIALLSMSGVSAITAATMYLIKPTLDKVFIAKDLTSLHQLLIILPVLFIVKGFLSYAQNYYMAYIGLYVVADLRRALFAHVQDLSLDFFTAKSTGKVIARFTNDLTALQQVVARTPIYLVRDGLTAIGLIGILIHLSWKFSLLTFTMLPVSAAFIWILGKSLRRVGRRGQNQMGELYSVIQENIQAAPVVKAYTAEQTEIKRFEQSNQSFLELSLRFAQRDTLSSPSMEMVGAIIASFLIWKGGSDVIQGVWSAGSFFAFMASALSIYRPLKNFAELNAQIQLGAASAERVFELLDEKPHILEIANPITLQPFSSHIFYDHVSFAYASRDPNTPELESPTLALKTISLRIERGQAIALVGSSGAGKSTLAMMLPRFYDPSDGAIRVDGINIKEASLKSLRHQIGLVTQDVLLFNESIRYNIAYGIPDADLQVVQAAAEAANAHRFISQLPNGYDTVIGERGLRLSGGERQRLSIARALLKNPPILVLDEATSALDAESERLVQEALEHLMKDRTAIVIAHRLATIRKADRIIVLEKGQIAEEGTHDVLLSQKGTYHKLHSLQLLQ